MKKPKKKEIRLTEDTIGIDGFKKGYNQGLSTMEAYYKGSELSEDEMVKEIINSNIVSFAKKVGRQLAEMSKAEYDDPKDIWLKNNSIKLAKAIISARDKKRGE